MIGGTTTNERIRFAVVGHGRIGQRHGAIIRGHADCELVATCDPVSPDAPTGVPHFENLDALLAAQLPLDVVCICTPNGLHAEQAVAVLRAGYHVVIEKPMALTRADCERIVYTALNVSRQVFCVMQNRYTPTVQWLREVLRTDRLGKVFLVDVRCYWNRDARYYRPGGQPHSWHGSRAQDGGPLFTQFSHFVDLVYWLFGDVTNLKGNFGSYRNGALTDFEDTGSVLFDFVNGGQGSLTYSTAVWGSNLESSITVLGERGSLKIGGQYMDRVDACHIKDYELPELPPANPPNDYGGYTGSAANHHFIFQNVVDTLRGGNAAGTNALEGMKVVDMIERMLGS